MPDQVIVIGSVRLPEADKSLRFFGTAGDDAQVYLALLLVEVSPRELVARTRKYITLPFV